MLPVEQLVSSASQVNEEVRDEMRNICLAEGGYQSKLFKGQSAIPRIRDQQLSLLTIVNGLVLQLSAREEKDCDHDPIGK